MSREADCVFCKIVSVELPAAVVYVDDFIVSFLDINPLAEGHILVIPRVHYANLTDMPSAECARMFSRLPRIGRGLCEVTGAEGFNVLVNEGRVAGQVVPHVHCHVIPRKPVDGLGYRWNAGEYGPGRAEELAKALQQALSQPGE